MNKFEDIVAIGEGSFGRVYQARHKKMNRMVALKVVRLLIHSLGSQQ